MAAKTFMTASKWCLPLVLVAASCGTKTEHITHLDVKVSWPSTIQLNQLRYEVDDGATVVVPGATLPQPAGNVLTSPQTVAILLKDSEVGKPLLVRADGLLGSKDQQWGSVTVTPVLNAGVPAAITLSHAPTAVLSSIVITGADTALAQGSTVQLAAIGAFSDGSSAPITTSANWTSGTPAVATVGNVAPSQGVVTALSQGSSVITCTLDGVTSMVTVNVSAAKLVSITVTPANPLVPTGATVSLVATGNNSDGTTTDLTQQVTWVSSNTAVATVDPDGTLHGVSSGSATISATLGTIEGTDIVAVTQATLQQIMIAPTTLQVAAGTTTPLSAQGVYTDRSSGDVTSSVTWSSSDTKIVTVSNTVGSKGQLVAVAPGTATITATQGGISGTALITVTQATLSSIVVSPMSSVLAGGTSLQMSANGVYSDGTMQNLTTSATWSSTVTTVATVRSDAGFQGQVSALAVGSTSISATFGGVSGSTPLTVTAATLTSIAVTPATPTLAKGTTQQMTATGTFSDGSNQNITSSVSWISSTPTTASVSNAQTSRGLATALAPGSTTVTASLGSLSGSTVLTVTAAQLTSVTLSAPSTTLANGTTLQLTATGIYSDGSSQPATATTTFTSSAPTIADVSNAPATKGLVTAKKVGSATITASLPTGVGTNTVMTTINLTVSAATLTSLSLSPTGKTIAKGTTQQFTLNALYSDGTNPDVTTTSTWGSSDNTVATISTGGSNPGLAVTTKNSNTGMTTITAQFGGLTTMTTLTVSAATLSSIAITPPAPSLAKGTTLQLTATGVYSDSTTQPLTTSVSWGTVAITPSPTPAASVSSAGGSQGLMTGTAPGTATVTATYNGVSSSVPVTVTAATITSISLSPSSLVLPLGSSQQVTATATYSDGSTGDITNAATYVVTDNTLANVTTSGTSGRGLVTSIGKTTGSTTLTVTDGGAMQTATIQISAATLTSIAVTASSYSLVKSTSELFIATGTYSDHTQQILTSTASWTTGSSSIATVSNASNDPGDVTGVGVGTTSVTASVGSTNPIVGSAQVTVSAATLKSIAVTATNLTIPEGTTQQFVATATYTDNTTPDVTKTVTWASSDAPASISNGSDHGLATASKTVTGTTNISATLPDGMGGTISGSAVLTVNAATLVRVDVTPTNPTIAVGNTQPFSASAVYTNGSIDVTSMASFTSGTPAVATIASGGTTPGSATGLAMGTTSITATYGMMTSAPTTLTVTPAVLTAIQITPTPSTTYLNTQTQFTATGIYSDGSNQAITANWSSTNSAVISISGAGLGSSKMAGTTAITATSTDGKVTSAPLNIMVSSATLTSITIAPASVTIPVNTQQAFTATGTWSDMGSQDITGSVTWSSTATTIATIDNTATANHGVATAVAAGSTSIGATLSGVNATTVTLTVSSSALKSISITPATANLPAGYTLALVCNAVYMDNSTGKCTRRATWSSGSMTSVTVSNATGSNGTANAVSAGPAVTITASFTVGSVTKTATAQITPTNETLSSIAVSPATPDVPAGTQEQFTAMGTFSAGTTLDLTTLVTWTSSVTTVATISNDTTTDGLATTQGGGTTMITAQVSGQSAIGSATLTVDSPMLLSVAIAPQNAMVPVGSTQLYTATGHYSAGPNQDISSMCSWSSDNTAAADFVTSAMPNLLTGIQGGSGNVLTTCGSLAQVSTAFIVPGGD